MLIPSLQATESVYQLLNTEKLNLIEYIMKEAVKMMLRMLRVSWSIPLHQFDPCSNNAIFPDTPQSLL